MYTYTYSGLSFLSLTITKDSTGPKLQNELCFLMASGCLRHTANMPGAWIFKVRAVIVWRWGVVFHKRETDIYIYIYVRTCIYPRGSIRARPMRAQRGPEGPRGAHMGPSGPTRAHGGPTQAWPTTAQGGPQGPEPTRAQAGPEGSREVLNKLPSLKAPSPCSPYRLFCLRFPDPISLFFVCTAFSL